MAFYNPHTWAAQVGTGLNKFYDSISGKNLQLTQAPDSITQDGTPFSATWMNELEQGVYQASRNTYQDTTTGTSSYASDHTISWYVEEIASVFAGATAGSDAQLVHMIGRASVPYTAPAANLAYGGLYRTGASNAPLPVATSSILYANVSAFRSGTTFALGAVYRANSSPMSYYVIVPAAISGAETMTVMFDVWGIK